MWLGLTAAQGAATDDLSLDDNRTKNLNLKLLQRGDEAEQKCQGLGHLAKPNVVRESLDGIIFPSKVIHSGSGITGLRALWLYRLVWVPRAATQGLGSRENEVIEKTKEEKKWSYGLGVAAGV